ncbi:hypothetical protein AB0B85_31655 [Micromonospora sp. NPDC049044]|uniref:hypothetical protein n=1 Tax=Micromonospora sp. NPDC049044 TaxID=3154827 RepID=UPI0033E1A6D7
MAQPSPPTTPLIELIFDRLAAAGGVPTETAELRKLAAGTQSQLFAILGLDALTDARGVPAAARHRLAGRGGRRARMGGRRRQRHRAGRDESGRAGQRDRSDRLW